ncbi:hypothetical protein [Luteimonas saliphila]|uniref:hypothetical protein n=1 Tax=Luteimonas saliphila TaxID=2804919 RepID=UPI00192D9E36|nr:hypothetical protein [Luteimonas saliphila]
MVGKLLVVVVVAIAALVAHENGRTIEEAHVREYYRSQLEALRAFDEEAVCAGIADDYNLEVVDRSEGQPGKATLDGHASCELSRKMLRFMEQMSGQTGGLVTIDISYDIRSIVIAADGRSATVEATSTAKLGDMLIGRTRGREQLSRSFWRVRSHGGEAQVWSYGR